ncbi:hypothetical protein AB76_3504 [Escherichia coli 3-267-03_S1_C3]|nr:hypothetical protein AB76_3504 [Escherichia coli 3-267-03_S1_C3]
MPVICLLLMMLLLLFLLLFFFFLLLSFLSVLLFSWQCLFRASPWRASIPDAIPRACSDRSGRAASVAPWPALQASRQKDAGM